MPRRPRRNIIRQGIRDGERGQMMQEFQSKHQELVTALVERIDPRTGAATLRIGKAEAVLPKSEQVGGEELKEGDHVKVYVVDVRETEKGPRAMISRTHPDLVKRLFETEVPEIYDGTVEIKAVSREAGVPHQAGRRQPQRGRGRGRRVHRRAWRPRVQHRQRAGRREDRHCGIQRRPGEIYRFRALPGDGPLRRDRGGTVRMPAASPCRTASFPWRSATRARTRAWRQS